MTEQEFRKTLENFVQHNGAISNEFIDKMGELFGNFDHSIGGRLNRVAQLLEEARENGSTDEYLAALQATQAKLAEALLISEELDQQGRNILKELAKSRSLDTKEVEIVQGLTHALQELVRREAELEDSKKKAERDGTDSGRELIEANLKKVREERDKLVEQAKDAAKQFAGGTESDVYKAVEAIDELYNTEEKRHEIAVKINKRERDSIENERELSRLKRENDKYLERGAQRWAAVKNVIGGIWKQVKSGGEMWLKYNAKAIADSKRLGITSIEGARAYTKNLMESSKELARNFGMSAEQAMKMREAYASATGRATLLTKSQMADIAASSKLMGEETVNNAIKIMDNMGTTSQTATELIDRNYARAVNSGLDTVKASEAFVNNLTLANKLTFKNGVDGISRMTILSQRVRMNLQEVANVADKFSTIEGALQSSAQLQMLGGAGAMYGGNPMQMMFEALSDPEALFERMTRIFGEQATFNRTTGEATIAPVQLQIIKEQAKALGMSQEEAVQSAKQQAKNKDIEAQFRAANPLLYGSMGEDEKSTILNKANYNRETRSWEVSYMTAMGAERTVGINNLTAADMAEIMKDQIDPVQDIRGRVREIASTLIGLRERTDSMKDYWKTSKAQAMNKPMEALDDLATSTNNGEGLLGGLWDIANDASVGTWMSMILTGALGMSGLNIIARANRRLDSTMKQFLASSGKTPPPTASAPTQTPSPTPQQPNARAGSISQSPNGAGQTASPRNRNRGSNLGRRRNRGGGRGGTRYNAPRQVTPTSTTQNVQNIRNVNSVTRGASQASNATRGLGSTWSSIPRFARIGGTALSVAGGALEAYQGWQEANVKYNLTIGATRRMLQSGRVSGAQGRSRDVMARNVRSQERAEAVGKGVGTAAGGLAGMAAGAAIGSAVPIIGTVVGGLIGGVVGSIWGGKAGKKVGNEFYSGDNSDTINTYLNEVNKGDTEENVRKIVLPIESIDYNVSLIANQLGIISARPAMNNVYMEAEANGEITAEGVPLEAGHVNPVDNSTTNNFSSLPSSGTFTLNISGKIELTGAGNGSMSAEDVRRLIDNNPELQRSIVRMITDRQTSNATAGGSYRDNANTMMGAVAGARGG